MIEALKNHLPEAAVELVADLLYKHPVEIKIVKNRNTKHGDFKRSLTGNYK